MNKKKLHKTFTIILSCIILACYLLLVSSLVFSKGVCCGDDAYFAIIAKNLANGLGFASTVQPNVARYTVQQFDPLIGTTPTIIIPAALLIKIFGNTYWAPGLSNLILWSLLLVGIGLFLQKYSYGNGFSLFTFSFIYLSYTFMPYHFEQWYALLGEVPAALLIILAVLCYLNRDSYVSHVFSGLLFASAVQAKFLALIAFAVFVLVQGLVYPDQNPAKLSSSLKSSLKRILYIIIGFSFPYILFESWKLSILGSQDYVENWHKYFVYVRSDGARFDQFSSVIVMLIERLQILLDRFGLLLPATGLVLMLVWLIIKEDKNLKYLYIVLVSIIVVYSFWWLFFSIGWARYFIICLILLIFVISLPLLSIKSKLQLYSYLFLVIIFTSNNWGRLKYPFEGLNGRYFSPIAKTEALLETSRILNQNIYHDESRIATQWWATAADIEYLMNDSMNFTTVWDDDLKNTDSFWVAVNTKFSNADFVDLLKNCQDLQQLDVYVLAKCEQYVFVP